ncbi:MAG TPA: hypothetical protein VNU26_08210 [Mycobacteriales bacterium]|nr:hypothetical protein [Mycobacteriales bacterium]
MASPVDAILVLCDAAVADQATGKVHMLGAGWSRTGSPTAPSAVVAMIKVPWDRANQRLDLTLHLQDSDGQLVTLSTPEGAQPVRADGAVEVGRPPGVTPGSPLDTSFVLSLPPLPLSPGRYEWRLHVAERDFVASFEVRQSSPGVGFPLS